MLNDSEKAHQFFDACETGKGWEFCSQFCHPDATFTSQASVLEGISSLNEYCEWMKNLLIIIPDGKYELTFFAIDEKRNCVAAIGNIKGTHTGEGGPVPPTGKSLDADYTYNMVFEGGLIKHMTKVWNDSISLQQLGWA